MSSLSKQLLDDMSIRGLAENTKKSYTRSVNGLVQHYRRSPDSISSQEVQDYLLYLHQKRGLAWSTCNVTLQGIRFFYRITLKRPEPYFYVPGGKRHSKLPEILNAEQIKRLFNAATNPKHRMLLITAYGAGLRVSELARLKVGDIDSKRMTIRINQGKGNKDRYVPLSPKLLDELRVYWRQVRPTDWLFPGRSKDGSLTSTGIAGIYSDTKAKAGITSAGGIHTLRHCYATRLLEAGLSLYDIQRRLGHASIRSTVRYLHLAMDSSTEAASPLELLESDRNKHA